MKFDVVIGNPPYQEEVSKWYGRVVPIYQRFILSMKNIPFSLMSFIIPTRWLIHITSSGMHLNRKSFMFVPILDFTKKWSDTDLYKRYKLSNDEIVYIESIIKQMD